MDSESPDEEKGRNTSEASKTVSNDVRDVREKRPRKKSAPKDGSKRPSTSATTTLLEKDLVSTQMVANIAEILKYSFASLSQSMHEQRV